MSLQEMRRDDDYIGLEEELLRKEWRGKARKTRRGDKTQQVLLSQKAQSSQEKRGEEAIRAIRHDLISLRRSLEKRGEEQALSHLILWLQESLAAGGPIIHDKDLIIKATTAGKPGGQRMQRKYSATRIQHNPTLIRVRAEVWDTFRDNVVAARGNLERKLAQHFQYWQTIVKDIDNLREIAVSILT